MIFWGLRGIISIFKSFKCNHRQRLIDVASALGGRFVTSFLDILVILVVIKQVPASKLKFILGLFLILTTSIALANSLWQKLDKSAYFEALATENKSVVEKQLEVLKGLTGTEKEAYEGTLLMKKAGMVMLPKDKLRYFKAGRIKLETALQADAGNAEYHFLRLIIEEHAPKIVKYKADIVADAALVRKAFKSFSPAVQHAVLDYSKTSKVLSPKDFE